METPRDRLELLDLLFGATSDGIVDWDLSTAATHYNDRFLYLLGWDDGELPLSSATWREFVHHDDRPMVENRLRDFLEDGWPFDLTVRMRHRSRGWRWILIRANSVRDDDNRATRVVLIFSDVDEQVRAEAQVRAILEALPDTIIRIRRDGKVLAVKDGNRFVSSPDVGASEPQGLFRAILDSDAGAEVLGYVSGGITNGEVALVRCHVGLTPNDRSEYDVRLVQSGPDEVVCVIRDVTRERKIEERLARAKRLDAIGQLAAGMAHEINTPLQFIGDNLGFAKGVIPPLLELITEYHAAVQDGSPSPAALAQIEQHERALDTSFLRDALPAALDTSLEGLEQISRIVRAMKTFEDVGGASTTEADINQIVENATIVAAHTWNRVARLSLTLAEGLPRIPCLAAEIEHSVVELILNAAHAIADKQGSTGRLGLITVSTTLEAARGMVAIQIEDDGIGIPESNRDKVFAPFFTTRRQGAGLGQGLCHVHAVVVVSHGGEISFTSREGQGTIFVIRLPTTAAPKEEDEVVGAIEEDIGVIA
jgi:PAS domain S-box-containing protein